MSEIPENVGDHVKIYEKPVKIINLEKVGGEILVFLDICNLMPKDGSDFHSTFEKLAADGHVAGMVLRDPEGPKPSEHTSRKLSFNFVLHADEGIFSLEIPIEPHEKSLVNFLLDKIVQAKIRRVA